MTDLEWPERSQPFQKFWIGVSEWSYKVSAIVAVHLYCKPEAVDRFIERLRLGQAHRTAVSTWR